MAVTIIRHALRSARNASEGRMDENLRCGINVDESVTLWMKSGNLWKIINPKRESQTQRPNSPYWIFLDRTGNPPAAGRRLWH